MKSLFTITLAQLATWSKILIVAFSMQLIFVYLLPAQNINAPLKLNEKSYFEKAGLNVLVFSNWYDGSFDDSKISGIEFIHHGVRTFTNGDVRLNPTPEQWDPIPKFIERKIDSTNNKISAYLSYPQYDFNYSIEVGVMDNGIRITVKLDKALPDELVGLAGFKLEFLPASYFEKSFMMDNRPGLLPLYPASSMEINKFGKTEPKPISVGSNLVLAPEDPMRRVIINSSKNVLMLFDGRNKAQNGWFVIRSMIPSGQTGDVIEWTLEANTIPDWIREPVITYSQVGYHPTQKKVAVIEFDKNDRQFQQAQLYRVEGSGEMKLVFTDSLKLWGDYLRYKYCHFDFSSIDKPGTYVIRYDSITTKSFLIDEDVYKLAWTPTLDIFFPVQMDHMFVNEAYRVWHGAAHLDDALQAPVNHKHFDLYAQGETTDSPYKPGEHIPGLNVGGWFDAGDFDIRTPTQYSVVQTLVQVWELFHPDRDETTINQPDRYVEIHRPDGTPDIVQQIEHGVLGLLAQHRSIGHAIPGIIVPDLSQYTHLGDALTMTDNLIYDSNLQPSESVCDRSGKFDDRWAFTNRSTSLNYGSIAALASAARVLKGYNDTLASECIGTAIRVWNEEHSKEPDTFRSGNTSGGRIEAEELKAAVELLICTGDMRYSQRIKEMLQYIKESFMFNSSIAVKAIPYMDENYRLEIKKLVESYSSGLKYVEKLNPFGVPISEGGWAGNGLVVGYAINNYFLHKEFPELIDREYVFRGLNYIFGTHPASNISFVSGVGTVSKKVAYGNNRADFSFIAGGVVPGVLILKPDFPENKEDWPFLWGENEYVIGLASSYILLVNAVTDLLSGE